MKVGYLGPEGSYSHIAAEVFWNKQETTVTKIAMKSLYEVIESIEEKVIDEGILPIENSTEGAVTQVMDALVKTKLSVIQGELILPIKFNLLASKDLQEIEYVYSHPQAIEQCRSYFNKNYPNLVLLPCESTSRACQLVVEEGKKYAAIANDHAEKVYNLEVIDRNIQDNCFNQTRFIVIGRRQMDLTGRDKTSITFSLQDELGSLFGVLKEFAIEGISLTRIESRPAKVEMGKYIFFIDFTGHQFEDKVKKTLNNIKMLTNNLKILGSYPLK